MFDEITLRLEILKQDWGYTWNGAIGGCCNLPNEITTFMNEIDQRWQIRENSQPLTGRKQQSLENAAFHWLVSSLFGYQAVIMTQSQFQSLGMFTCSSNAPHVSRGFILDTLHDNIRLLFTGANKSAHNAFQKICIPHLSMICIHPVIGDAKKQITSYSSGLADEPTTSYSACCQETEATTLVITLE